MEDHTKKTFRYLMNASPVESMSIRTTFKVRKSVYQSFQQFANQVSLPPKAIFDMIVFDKELIDQALLPSYDYEAINESQEYVKKTFVISNKAKQHLNILSADNQIPRDELIESFIIACLSNWEETLRIETENEKKASVLISNFAKTAVQTQKELINILGRSHSISIKFRAIVKSIEFIDYDV